MLIHDLEAIGNKLYEYRKAAGLSQEAVAELADVSHRTYSDIERGVVNARIATLLNICDALNITPDDIFTIKSADKSALSIDDLIARCKEKERLTALTLLNVYLASLD